MRTLSNSLAEEKYRAKFEKMLRSGRFEDARQIAAEHEKLLCIKEQFFCNEITARMAEQDRELANFHLRKICILSDIVESAGVDMLSLLRKYDNYLSLPLVGLLKNLQRTAREITRIIDAVGNEKYAASFGDVCDEIDNRIQELFNKGSI